MLAGVVKSIHWSFKEFRQTFDDYKLTFVYALFYVLLPTLVKFFLHQNHHRWNVVMVLWRVVKNVIVVATMQLNVQRLIRAVYLAIVPSRKE